MEHVQDRETRGKEPVELSAAVSLAAPHRLPGCLDWRWIAQSGVDDCPTPDPPNEWRVTRPLPDVPAFSRLCVYEYNFPDLIWDPSAIDRLWELVDHPNEGLVQLERDCAVIAPQGSDDPDWIRGIWEHLSARLANQAGALSSYGWSAPLRWNFEPFVKVKLFDTSPTLPWTGFPELAVGTNAHGNMLTNIALSLYCDPDNPSYDCLLSTSTNLVTPWSQIEEENPAGSVAPENGGHVGTLVDLILSVLAETQVKRNDAPLDRWIFNYSVGFDPQYRGALGLLDPDLALHDMPLAVEMLVRALEFGTCHRIIHVAAAGNDIFAPTPRSGPLLPGGFEVRSAPNSNICIDDYAGDPENGDIDPDGNTPLLVAAGGVGENDDPLVNTPFGGQPSRVLFAEQALVSDRFIAEPYQALTGTSVASIELAALIGALAKFHPEATARELIEMTYTYGSEIDRRADFCHVSERDPVDPTQCRHQHRIHFCSVLARSCAQHPFDNCPPQDTFECHDVEPPAVTLSPQPEDEVAQLTEEDICGAAGEPCGFELATNLASTPWLVPQPSPETCPTCALFLLNKYFFAYIYVKDKALANSVTGVFLEVAGVKYKLRSTIKAGRSYWYKVSANSATKGKIWLLKTNMVGLTPVSTVPAL